jgi:hypothetical protein
MFRLVSTKAGINVGMGTFVRIMELSSIKLNVADLPPKFCLVVRNNTLSAEPREPPFTGRSKV